MTIPFADPGRWFSSNREALEKAVRQIMDSGQYILGPAVSAFEAAFARFCNTRHAVAVASGTDALTLGLMAVEVSGGEVITSGHTATATIAAIERAGATPVLADIEPASRCVRPDAVEQLCNNRTRAIVAVHMYGHPADMANLGQIAAERNLPLVEDCAQAHGAKVGESPVGSVGVAGAFSFYPTKNIGAMGDAGAVVTNDDYLAERIRQLRQYGWNSQRESELRGCNSRMDEIQAAILQLRLGQFDRQFQRRRQIAARYRAALLSRDDVLSPAEHADSTHAYHLFVVESDRREELAQTFAARDIQTARHYPIPLHRQPAYCSLPRGHLAETERLYSRILSIPIYPELKDDEVALICDTIRGHRG